MLGWHHPPIITIYFDHFYTYGMESWTVLEKICRWFSSTMDNPCLSYAEEIIYVHVDYEPPKPFSCGICRPSRRFTHFTPLKPEDGMRWSSHGPIGMFHAWALITKCKLYYLSIYLSIYLIYLIYLIYQIDQIDLSIYPSIYLYIYLYILYIYLYLCKQWRIVIGTHDLWNSCCSIWQKPRVGSSKSMSCCTNLWGCYFGSLGRGLPDLVNVAVPLAVPELQFTQWLNKCSFRRGQPINPRFGGQIFHSHVAIKTYKNILELFSEVPVFGVWNPKRCHCRGSKQFLPCLAGSKPHFWWCMMYVYIYIIYI